MHAARLAVTALFILATAVWGTTRKRVRSTTLLTAWNWASIAIAVWWLAWIAGFPATRIPPAVGELIWYLAAILSLCPGIAILGARRPAVRVWTWFVLLPLVAVFIWPVLPGLIVSGPWVEPRLSLPMLLGFALVLTMGAGNFLATRYTFAAGLALIAVCCVIAPIGETNPLEAVPNTVLRTVATGLLAAAVLLSRLQAARPTLARDCEDRLWFDFRDTFGFVWGRRILERINERAEAEAWVARLTEDGFHWIGGRTPADEAATRERIRHTFRWLMQKFADSDWVDSRISETDAAEGSSPST